MQYAGSTLTVEAIPELMAVMSAWQPTYGCASGLHPGDIGWNLAWPDEQSLPAIRLWRDADGRLRAVGIADGPGEWRLTTDPALAYHPALAATLAEELEERGDGAVSIDLPAGPTLLAARLVADGFASGQTLWPLLFRAISGPLDPPGDVSPIRPDEFAARAEVEHSAFGGALVDLERWGRMHSRPGCDAGLDLVARAPDGRVAAGATAWSAGPGRPGLLEPVATHADQQRQGYGRRVVEGACAALAARGASGVSVHTPAFNRGAIATYRAAGFRIIGWTAPLVRESSG